MRKSRPHPVKNESPKFAAASETVVFGVLPVLESLKAERRSVEKVLIAEGSRERRFAEVMDVCRQRGIAWSHVSRDKIAGLVPPGANHQGIVALVSPASYVEVDEIISASETPLIVLLDGIEDPRNLGAVIRTAECAGADGVIIPERRAVGLNETVARSSAGALEYMRVARSGNLNRTIEDLKRNDIWVVGTSIDASIDHTQWDWRLPSALVLGSEGSGLHRLVAENCDTLVKIPMYGKIDSLNVSVAAGVILFEARRQRSGGNEDL